MRTLLFAPALVLTACTALSGTPGGDAGSVYHEDVLPREEQVRIDFPADQGASAKAEGEVSAWARYYVATRETTEHVNGLIAYILGTVSFVTTLEPHWLDAEAKVAVWGPYSDSGLDPVETGLWVQAEDDGSYTWAIFQVPNGGDIETDSVVIVAGEVDSGATRTVASGAFVADFAAASSMDPAVELTGDFAVEYAYDEEGVVASAGFEDYGWADGGERIDALYAYAQDGEGAGTMDLAWLDDLNVTGTEELLTMRSRWQADGQGRADATISNGDLGVEVVTASECWGTDFSTTFWSDSLAYYESEGSVDACAFAEAEYATEASFSILD